MLAKHYAVVETLKIYIFDDSDFQGYNRNCFWPAAHFTVKAPCYFGSPGTTCPVTECHILRNNDVMASNITYDFLYKSCE